MTSWLERRHKYFATVKKIMREVCDKHGILEVEFLGERHSPVYVAARQEACWRARNETGASFPLIGEVFNRDHSTILYSVRKYSDHVKRRANLSDCFGYPHDSQIVQTI